MTSLLYISLILAFAIFLWRQSKKEKEANQSYVVLNTLDYYFGNDPDHVSFKIHRRYNAEFLLNPVILYQVVYSKVINSKLTCCSVFFRFDAREERFIHSLEIWDDKLILAACPISLKMNKSTLFEIMVKELESRFDLPVETYNETAVDEYKKLALQYLKI